jgi:hypothetical protein
VEAAPHPQHYSRDEQYFPCDALLDCNVTLLRVLEGVMHRKCVLELPDNLAALKRPPEHPPEHRNFIPGQLWLPGINDQRCRTTRAAILHLVHETVFVDNAPSYLQTVRNHLRDHFSGP